MTTPQKYAAAALVLLVIVLVVAYRHSEWMKKNCVCTPSTPSGFHGWRFQHYDDNPYTQQRYHCGVGAKGYHYPGQLPNPTISEPHQDRESFSGDADNWPGSGTFGALADTYPYGNYADGLATFYPTYNEYNPFWTRA